MYQFQSDFKKDFWIDLPHGKGFTKSDFFHFAEVDGKKYVHKEAMRFVLTNGGSYFLHQKAPEGNTINTNAAEIQKIDLIPEKMFSFFRNDINNHKIYPKLLSESENFFVFEFYDDTHWTRLDHLTPEDSKYIKQHYVPHHRNTKEVVTPFFNQMVKKLFRNNSTGEIVMVDLKSLEFRPVSNLAVLMYNGRVNDLYLLERRFVTRKYILKPYALDYPVHFTSLIRHY
jgi:hypothetical protein